MTSLLRTTRVPTTGAGGAREGLGRGRGSSGSGVVNKRIVSLPGPCPLNEGWMLDAVDKLHARAGTIPFRPRPRPLSPFPLAFQPCCKSRITLPPGLVTCHKRTICGCSKCSATVFRDLRPVPNTPRLIFIVSSSSSLPALTYAADRWTCLADGRFPS